jgi:hypothetical protein
MRRIAPNFAIEPGVPVTGHPLPTISYVTGREIQVQIATGQRTATEVTIHGSNFLIRAVEPEVLINGQPLVSYRIADDFQSITGYFFGVLTQPMQVIVDYGLGVRGEWTGPGVVIPGKRSRLLFWLLVALLLILLLAIALLEAGRVTPLSLSLGLLIGAVVLVIIALVLVRRP